MSGTSGGECSEGFHGRLRVVAVDASLSGRWFQSGEDEGTQVKAVGEGIQMQNRDYRIHFGVLELSRKPVVTAAALRGCGVGPHNTRPYAVGAVKRRLLNSLE